ncbi:unnamed protein product [Sympodiomycopsis kandeliae]
MAALSLPPTKHPRVGIAAFIVDDRNYILIGKRKGSNGAGTLALPGGHLEWQESFEQCASREVLEETGIEIAEKELEYCTLMNVRNLKDPNDTDEGKHYVTIFMKGRVERKIGQEDVPAKVMEPTKCDGWVWVPLNYLFARHQAQSSLERYASSAAASGDTMAAPLDRLLMAERLGQRISGAAESSEGISTSGATQIGSESRERRGGIDPDRLQPQHDDDIVAFTLADDLAQGAALFRPLGDLLQTQAELLKREFGTIRWRNTKEDSNATAPSPSTAAPQLPPSILSDDATAIINDALKAPPHLKHSLTLNFPAPTPHHAEQIASILRVDKPLRPYDTTITYSTQSTNVNVQLKTSTVRLMRLAVNAILEDISLICKTMEAFPGPLRAHEVESLQQSQITLGDNVFEEGTVGTVEKVLPVN